MTVGALTCRQSGSRLDTIREHKLRAFLTVLGVIIGTGTMIGVGSIIAGLDGAITGILRSFGPEHADRVQVLAAMGIGNSAGRAAPQAADVRECASPSPSAARRWSMSARILFPTAAGCTRARYKGNDIYNIQMGGTEEGYAAGGTTMKCGPLLYRCGKPPSHAGSRDRRGRSRSSLFPNMDPIGKWIEVDGHSVRDRRRDGPARRFHCPGRTILRVLLPTSRCGRCSPARGKTCWS